MKRKTAVYKGLQFIPVWFEDRSLTSPDYFQITNFPTRLTAGKNLFKLRGHPTSLKLGGPLSIEILDYNGDPIYHEIINYIDDDTSRSVALYIYNDTSPGDCTITILAEAANVPEEWKGRFNVKWTRTVPVNPNVSNISEIIFDTTPTVNITEQIGPHLDRTYPNDIQFPTYTTGQVKYYSYNKQPVIEINGGTFTNDMNSGTVTVTSPVNATPTIPYPVDTTEFSSTIKKVLSPTLALLDKEYVVYSSKSLNTHTYTQFDNSSFSLSYEAAPVYTPTQNSESYALVEISNLQPSTGDVSRIKIFMNNTGTVGTWEQINDIELAETELFVGETGSIRPDTSIGSFTTQSIIDTYWEGHSYRGFEETTAPVLTWNTASINNAMQISNSINISAKNTVSVAQIKSAYKSTFIQDSEYKITIDALGSKTNTDDAVLSLYMSGSAFSYDATDYFNQEFSKRFGKRVGELRSNSNNRKFDDNVFTFAADKTGDAVLLLVVENGFWEVADIRTTSDNDTGYTPNYTRFKTLVPTAHKANNQLSFKIEYYNVNGEKSKQQNFVYNKPWEGGNRYIDGNYSMITGSVYVADSLESGIAISGYKNSGFIRSLGYEGFEAGFPGFLIWSGSALSGSLGTKGAGDYSGVGLEMYANTASYFRYSTADSEIDIRTDKFFFGNPSSSFISGSNGNLQISSSNFEIDANGDVKITGTVNITAGSGFETPSSVSASINAATSSLSASINTTITNTSSSLSGTITINSQSAAVALVNTSASINNTITSNSQSAASSIQTAFDRIVTDANSKIVKPVNTPAGGNGLYLTSRYLGYYSTTEDWKSYISNSGEFLFKKDANNLLSFGNDSFILKTETATISGSSVNIVTPNFVLGTPTQYIAGADSKIRIATPNFFLGDSATQFISGSDGKLQIKSDNFEIDSNGNVSLTGNVTITGGNVTPASISGSINSATGSLSASINTTIVNTSSSINTTITSNSASAASTLNSVSASLDSKIVTDADNKIVKPNDTPTGTGLYLSSNYLGYYNNSTWNAYIRNNGDFLFKKDDNNLLSFGNNSFILKISDTATISGSNVNIVAPTFFLGNSSQYISGSDGKIEIKSNNFNIDSVGNVSLTGNVTITGGNVTPTTISGSINSATGSLSASINTTIVNTSSSINTTIINTSSSLSGTITNNSQSAATSIQTAYDRIVTDADNKIVKTNDTPSAGNGLYLSSKYLGYYEGSTWKSYISNSGEFKFQKDPNNLISFGNNSFILKISDEATISGSSVNIVTPNFYFGNNLQFISGSNGNLQIKSNNFNIDTNGDVSLTGNVTITGGNVTPASISESINAATGSLSGSINTTITNTSSSLSTTITNTSSSLSTTITNTSSSINTTITNTSASINTTIANTSASINTTITDTSASITNTIVTDANSKIVKPVNTPAGGNGLYLTSRYLGYYSSGDSDWKAYISNSGEFLFKQNDNNLLSFGNNAFTLKTETATISGSAVNLVAPRFWLGNPTSQFISGSNGKLQISASNFSIKADGSITASNMDISGISAASVILNKAVIITAANSSSYLELKEPAPSTTYFTPYYKLHLDGALPGGRSIQKVIINCQFPKSTRSTPAPTWTDVQLAIGDIVFPAGIVGQNGLATCIIEVATSSVYFRDDIPNSGFIPSAWQSLSWNGIINEPGASIPYSGNWDDFYDGQWNEGPTG